MTIRLRKDEKEQIVAAEEWRGVPGFPGYEVSNLGRVRSWRWCRWGADTPLVMKVQVNDAGYSYVRPRVDGKYRHAFIHSLVALAFVGPQPEGLEVRHLDGIKENNTPGNLTYGTRKENTEDKLAHGTHRRGVRNPMAKLTEGQVADILAARAAQESCRSIARRYGLSHQHVSDIVNGKRWSHGDSTQE